MAKYSTLEKHVAKKRNGGELRGKCFYCGEDASLPIHDKCSAGHHTIDYVRTYGDRECKNLDCLKPYTATAHHQKFCPECSEIMTKLNNEKYRGY